MNELSLQGINWPAVVVAAVVTFLLGGMWYAPLFGKAWVKAHGFTQEQVTAMQAKRPMPVFFGLMVVCYLLLAVIVAVIFEAGGIHTLARGAAWGLVLWLALAALKMTDHLASGKPFAAFGIDGGFQLIAMLLTGAIIGGWN